MRKLLVVLALCFLGASLSPACWAKHKTYVVLGDSYAFGYTTDNPADPDAFQGPSYGEPGYVAGYARALDPRSSNSPNKLQTVNLAIPGETSTTFFTGGSYGAPANLHYSSSLYPVYSDSGEFLFYTNAQSQFQRLLETIEKARAQKREIYRITIHLGGNDLQELLSDPEYVYGDDAARQAKLRPVLARVAANYERLLATLREKAPEARVVILGYPNAFRALGAFYQSMTEPAIQGLNAVLAREAARWGARYVDVYTPFLGHEGEWTYILDPYGSPGPIYGTRLPNAHPRPAGYGVMADLLVAQEKRR